MSLSASHPARRPLPCSAALCGAAAAALLAGCASPGMPRPPSLHLPDPVASLTAQRRGPSVVLSFVTPAKSTDGSLLTQPVRAGLCRAVAAGPCQPTASFPGLLTVAGPVEWVDTLPPELASGPPGKLTYKVQLFNPAGRTAGWSDPATTASGRAPAPIEALHAEGERGGIVLRWAPENTVTGEVLLERKSLAPPQPPTAAKPSTKASVKPAPHKHFAANLSAAAPKDRDTVWLHASPTRLPQDSGGTVDSSAKPDTPYRYTALRSRTVTLDGTPIELRSLASSPVEITLRDIYPPAVPRGLTAAEFPVEGAGTLSVDLIWQPNLEPDLAGYLVYRQPLSPEGSPSGGAEQLTPKPIPLPAFRDPAAAHNNGYRYTVTAIDTKGNASPPSQPTDVHTAP